MNLKCAFIACAFLASLCLVRAQRPVQTKWECVVGIAAGQETIAALPKVGLYRKFDYGRARSRFARGNKYFYAGGEVSTFVFFAGTFTGGLNAGVRYRFITLDNSISGTAISSPESEIVGKYCTYNPKFGIWLGPVWIKAGPSFLVSGQSYWGTFVDVGDTPFNVELLFRMEI